VAHSHHATRSGAVSFSMPLVLAAVIAALGSCQKLDSPPLDKYQVVIPEPRHHHSGDEDFTITRNDLKAVRRAAKETSVETWRIVKAQLMSRLPNLRRSGKTWFEEEEEEGPGMGVHFLRSIDEWKGAESWEPIRERNETYSLSVEPGRLVVDASSSWGLANAMATLYQLIEIKESQDPEKTSLRIPGCPHNIHDRPAFPHRGLLVDTSRTFYTVDWLKTLVVQLTQFKINILHLHLTDTSAWSFEVKNHPEIAERLAYRDINGRPLYYTRKELKQLVEFGRRRGLSIVPEVDGPVHAPTLASAEPLKMTVATGVAYTSEDYGVEPPVGTWNFTDTRTMQTLNEIFQQLEEDFVTSPYLHVGGDEPKAAAVCAALANESLKSACLTACTAEKGGNPYSAPCRPTPSKPAEATETYWFPDELNAHIQKYFDDVVPQSAKMPTSAWAGVREDMGLNIPSSGRPSLQLWEFSQPGAKHGDGLSEEDCHHYDLIQSSATRPLKKGSKPEDGYSDEGWLYLECGAGQNWISMGKSYWCSRAPWVAIYSLNITQHASVVESKRCQKAYLGAEMALWGEISGGNSMSMIFPRIAAFAERTWTNPPALSWSDLSAGQGIPPASYWEEHLRDALHRLNAVVENFVLQDIQSSRLQPRFCFDHPEYCDHYTKPFLPAAKEAVDSVSMPVV